MTGVRYKNGSTTTDYYFVCNWRGDVIRIYDGAGTVVANYNYDVWGNVSSVTDANGAAITDSTHIANVNPLRYRGYYFDSETGFYYVSSRYYDPEIERWINADSSDTLTASFENFAQYNVFAYCFNNSVNMCDLDGFWAFAIAGADIWQQRNNWSRKRMESCWVGYSWNCRYCNGNYGWCNRIYINCKKKRT